MLLLGTNRSPFTRRVAISLRLLGYSYELNPITSWTHMDEIAMHNPLGQIPVLILDDGEALFDSGNILAYLDEAVGPERALLPASGPARRLAMRTVAIALGVIEKGRILLYERHLRPEELRYSPWIERWSGQIRSGLAALDAEGDSTWFSKGGLAQAGVTCGVMYDFMQFNHPDLMPDNAYPRLDAHAANCRRMEAFQSTSIHPESTATVDSK